MGFITAGDAAAQGGSGPCASAVDVVSGAAADGSSAFERTALGLNAAASFAGKKAMPPTLTMRTGPACPWCTDCLASGYWHASSNVVNLDGLDGSDVRLMAASSSRVGGDLNCLIPRASKICRRTGLDCVDGCCGAIMHAGAYIV